MRPRLITLGFILLLLLSFATASARTIPTTHHALQERTASGTNTTTLTYPMIRIDMPATSGLNVTNDGFVTESGFGIGLSWDVGVGVLGLVNLTVIDGPLTIKTPDGEELTLNPGDNLTVLFGVFHYCIYQPPGSFPKGFLIGRFMGVTIQHTG